VRLQRAVERAALVSEQVAAEQLRSDSPQFTATNLPLRPLRSCTARATSSLPVPLSP
jgi:hypothetical protein